jgi:sRNA-binding regulator protein Hfq
MKNLILLLLLLLLVGGAFGQKEKNETVFLKNGSVIKGRLVQVDDQNVVIRSHRNVWVLNRSEIDTVAVKVPVLTDAFVAPRWFAECSAGVLLGSADNKKQSPFSIDFSANLQMLPGLYAGLGTGVDFLEESFLPVFVNLEYHFRPAYVTPFIGMKGGYLFPLEDDVYDDGTYMLYDYYNSLPWYPQSLDNKGGIMLNPSVGFISRINGHLGLSLAFGYRFSQVKYKGEEHYEIETNYNRLSIRLGILFN